MGTDSIIEWDLIDDNPYTLRVAIPHFLLEG